MAMKKFFETCVVCKFKGVGVSLVGYPVCGYAETAACDARIKAKNLGPGNRKG